jgi:hypothetical protein
MKNSKIPAIYNINFPMHLSMHYSINQHLWDIIKTEIDFISCDPGIHISFAPAIQSLSQQGFYSSPVIGILSTITAFNQYKTDFNPSSISTANRQNERTFVRFNQEFDSTTLVLKNAVSFTNLLLQKASESPMPKIFWPGIAWVDDRGYCCFQPTAAALAQWLQFLWARPPISPLVLPHTDESLVYIAQRCAQLLKLASPADHHWLAGELQLITSSEQTLVWGLIEVYDALHNSLVHKVKIASKSLIERFLEFDRHCRLLDLAPNSAELSARAGLIVLVQRAAIELLIQLETI